MDKEINIKTSLNKIFEFIKKADRINFDINYGIFEFPNQKSGFMESGYDGNTTICFEVYYDERNETNKVIKRAFKE